MGRIVRAEESRAEMVLGRNDPEPNCAADQRLCFHYIDSAIPLIYSLHPSSERGCKPQRQVFSQHVLTRMITRIDRSAQHQKLAKHWNFGFRQTIILPKLQTEL